VVTEGRIGELVRGVWDEQGEPNPERVRVFHEAIGWRGGRTTWRVRCGEPAEWRGVVQAAR